MKNILIVFFAITGLLISTIPAQAGSITVDVPGKINKNEKYLIYLHGISVEIHGSDSYSDLLGRTYENTKITKTFAERGFNVIAEVREAGEDSLPKNYSEKVARQIIQLVKAGVPEKNITVVGHSRGAFTALFAAAQTFKSDVNYAILAGCALDSTDDIAGFNPRRAYNTFTELMAEFLNGRFLVLYDKSDEWFGTCREAFGMAEGIVSKEIVLQTGEGHAVFLSPNPVWIELVIKWANQEAI